MEEPHSLPTSPHLQPTHLSAWACPPSPSPPQTVLEGDLVNLGVTSPAAALALGLMYLQVTLPDRLAGGFRAGRGALSGPAVPDWPLAHVAPYLPTEAA